ncbi:hypothetical protein DBR43_30315 [Pedobacter sp. KBW06]|nr:hypothetical protein DBR43_30315 [Pedobacter sp. KBW06]
MLSKEPLHIDPLQMEKCPIYFRYIYFNKMIPLEVEKKLFQRSLKNGSVLYSRENLNRPISKIIKL